jgi:GT2 family glycosyltransferase
MNLTVIIPACERPEALARCLHALPAADDIIVTDDSTSSTVRELIARDFPRVRWMAGPRRGPAANRNGAAAAAGGEWLVFVDDDCEPQPGWLEAIAAATGDADVIEGRTLAPGATDSPFEEHIENLHGGVLWSCNLAVRREVFERLRGFDEDFAIAGGEDMEFAWRVQRAGLRVRFAPDALVHHPPRHIGWAGLWRRQWTVRWMSLYRVKTGQSQPLLTTAVREFVNLLRTAAHLFSKPEPGRWRRRTFAVCWRGLAFPLTLPWILYWEHRYRTQFR